MAPPGKPPPPRAGSASGMYMRLLLVAISFCGARAYCACNDGACGGYCSAADFGAGRWGPLWGLRGRGRDDSSMLVGRGLIVPGRD
jgi:hypothetical protein